MSPHRCTISSTIWITPRSCKRRARPRAARAQRRARQAVVLVLTALVDEVRALRLLRVAALDHAELVKLRREAQEAAETAAAKAAANSNANPSDSANGEHSESAGQQQAACENKPENRFCDLPSGGVGRCNANEQCLPESGNHIINSKQKTDFVIFLSISIRSLNI